MIVDLPDTTTVAVSKKLVQLREAGGAVSLSRVLTLVVLTRDPESAETAIEAANEASREHPCRVIVLVPLDRRAEPSIDAQIRVGGDAGASEVVVLRLHGPLADHEDSVVVPFLLPDTPVVAWWPDVSPDVPAADAVGRLAVRRITDATNTERPKDVIASRLATYTAGDTDLAWSRITYWRALLTSSLDQVREPVTAALVSGLEQEPALDVLAGWLAARLGVPVTRTTGDLRVELTLAEGAVVISRPQTGTTAVLTRPGQPDQRVSLARRETRDCLAEELRRLDPDDTYAEALAGLTEVTYA